MSLGKSETPDRLSEIKPSRDESVRNNKNALISINSKAASIIQNRESKQPKKGSYAEIMARGKAAHAILGQVGRITHKNIEKPPSKREREEMKTLKSQKKTKTSDSSEMSRRLDNGRERSSGKINLEPAKKIKKSALATTGYTGTARPKSNSLPTMSRASTTSSSKKDLDIRRSSSRSMNRYLSEDEEEYDEEDQYYESDLSDMEADTFEVDEEEEIAAKIARREDAEALAEENRLKREKEAKRKKLAAMAKSRSGR